MRLIVAILVGLLCLVSNISLQATDLPSRYPVALPRTENYLQVSARHHLFFATYGNPDGIPVVVLHGGPGEGCSDAYCRFFDLNSWYVVMFDQRGAMRSQPSACMEENTTQDHIADIEALRKHLGINQWAVFGHSWGSCLGVAYGEAHPESCLGFILEGIFLAREEDVTCFSDMEKRYPAAYEDFLTHIPLEGQTDIAQTCYQRIMDPDPEVHMSMARALMRYYLLNRETPPSDEVMDNILRQDVFVLSFLRAVVHYTINNFFLRPNQILADLHRVSHLPAILVHGNADTVCPLEYAFLLHDGWDSSQLWVVEEGGHSCMDPQIVKKLAGASDELLLSIMKARAHVFMQ